LSRPNDGTKTILVGQIALTFMTLKQRPTYVPQAFGQDGLTERFHCDFNLDLGTLTDEELHLHDALVLYSVNALKANLKLLERTNPEPSKEITGKMEKISHALSIYAAYRSKLNIERAIRRKDKPIPTPIEKWFMIAAKRLLPHELYQEVYEAALQRVPE
jgi:hypothetical protein